MNETHVLLDIILKEANKGNVVFWSLDTLSVVPLDEFISQPTNGLLYDLNRSPEVITTIMDDPKWVNDYAVYLVIKCLKERVGELEQELWIAQGGK